MESIISSEQNNKIKSLRKLYDKRYRKKQGKYILEGFRIIKEALNAGAVFDDIYVTPEFYKSDHGGQVLGLLKKNINIDFNKISPVILESKLMNNIADTNNPQGIIAVVNEVQYNVEDVLDNSTLLLLLDRIQDPGNMGTMIRTAVAAGVDGLIILKGSVDIYNLKVLRATMGSIFNIAFIKDLGLEEFIDLYRKKASNYTLVSTDISARKYYYDLDYRGKIIIAIGNEANGLNRKIVDISKYKVKIPIIGEIDSLNAAMAGGIILYEVLRKKRN